MDEAVELAEVLLGGYRGKDDPRLALSRALCGAERDRSHFHPDLLARLEACSPDDLAVKGLIVERAHFLRRQRAAVEAGRPAAWQLVLTAPAEHPTDHGIVLRTGATIRDLITRARDQIRLYAPYTTIAGLELLRDELLFAVRQGVRVELTAPESGEASQLLSGLPSELRSAMHVGHVRPEAPWPHLKIALIDRDAAYVGSANLTVRGLAGGNLELGVLVRGPDVHGIDALLDSIVLLD